MACPLSVKQQARVVEQVTMGLSFLSGYFCRVAFSRQTQRNAHFFKVLTGTHGNSREPSFLEHVKALGWSLDLGALSRLGSSRGLREGS